jgi:carbonic anhydrase
VAQGAKSKVSAIFHGVLLMVSVVFLPQYLNTIPLAALAAILLVTGSKLASPKLFKQMWKEGRYQFIPFIVTLLAIVFTDLLKGILIGLATGIFFILNSNLRRPVRRIVETHLGGEVLHIELANQVSFLNKAALSQVFNDVPAGSKVLIDASDTDFIDPDALSLIREFCEKKGPARGVSVNLRGFRDKYEIHDEVMFADYSTRELREQVTPQQVLEWLQEGNRRFREGHQLSRDFQRQIKGTAAGQSPMAVVLSCIDSRVPVEVVFDLGIGDTFTARVAGNVLSEKTLGSLEYGVVVAGAKLVMVLGHTRCGAVTSAIQLSCSGKDAETETGCAHLSSIVDEIAANLKDGECPHEGTSEAETEEFVDEIARRNVLRTVQEIRNQSEAIRKVESDGNALVVGAMYDVKTGDIAFLT